MPTSHSFTSATLAELNRRKVLRTVGGYAVAVFVLLQLMDAAFEPLRLPEWLPTIVVIVVILGFPLVFLLAWHLELRSDGIHRTTRAGLLSRSQSALLFSFMLLAMGGLGYVFYQYYSGVFDNPSVTQAAPDPSFTAPRNSIAVLPFADLSESGDQAHVSDGIAEEILNLLAQVDGLQVAARTSSFAFRGEQRDIREIGRLLNVSTLLEGSLRTSGDRIRLTAQLINVEDGYHIWSKFYDREMTDIFAIQDEVASEIADALVDSFDGLAARPATRTDNLAASQAYRTGRLHWWRRTPFELQRAVELFAEALQHDAGYAPAYAALADSWLLLSLYGNVSKQKAIDQAQDMIERALSLDPESAEAYAALGLARMQIGQLDAAESALRQAVELNADYIPAQLWLAGVLGQQGRYPEESLVLEEAMKRDPLNELLASNYANNLSTRGDWATGRDLMQRLVDLRPDSTTLLRSMARLETVNGNLLDGWRFSHRAWLLEPDNPEDIAAFAASWMTLGELEQAEQLLEAGLEQSAQNTGLLHAYWQLLMVGERYEEAESRIKEWFARDGEELPAAALRERNYQLGILAVLRGDFPAAFDLLQAAAGDEDAGAYTKDQVSILSLAALAADRVGDEAAAASLAARAERIVRRARVNGVDDPDIYYTEAVLLARHGEIEPALEKLQAAVDRGFREQWLLEADVRLDALREEPGFAALKNRLRDDIETALTRIHSLDLAVL